MANLSSEQAEAQGKAILDEAAEQVSEAYGMCRVELKTNGSHGEMKVHLAEASPISIQAECKARREFGRVGEPRITIACNYGVTFQSRIFPLRKDGTYNREKVIAAILEAVAAAKQYEERKVAAGKYKEEFRQRLRDILDDCGMDATKICNIWGEPRGSLGPMARLEAPSYLTVTINLQVDVSILGFTKLDIPAEVSIKSVTLDDLPQLLTDLQQRGLVGPK